MFAYGEGFSVPQTSIFMAAGIVGGLLLQWPMGRLSDRIDRRTVLAGVALGTAAASFGVWLMTGKGGASFTGVIVIVVAYGGLSSTVYSMCAAHANDFAPSDKLAQTASGLLIAYGLGASAGPVLTSSLMEMFGASTLFMVNAWVARIARRVRALSHVPPRTETEVAAASTWSRHRAASSHRASSMPRCAIRPTATSRG